MKIFEIARPFVFEVGEPAGSPENPFGDPTQPPATADAGIDLGTVPGGEPQGNQAAPSPMPAIDDMGMDDEDDDIDPALMDLVKKHPLVSTRGSDDHDVSPSAYLSMGVDELKAARSEAKKKMADISINSAGGLWDNEDYKYLQDLEDFLSELIDRKND